MAYGDAKVCVSWQCRWAVERGTTTQLSPARFSNGLRGLCADQDTAAGSCVLSLPASLLITYNTAKASDFGRAVSGLPGMDDESCSVLWTMVERHDEDSSHRPFWEALPQEFETGGYRRTVTLCSATARAVAKLPCAQLASHALVNLTSGLHALGFVPVILTMGGEVE